MWWRKKNSWVGETSWYHCVAEDSRIPKILAVNPLQARVYLQTQKTVLHGLSIPNPNFSEFAYFCKQICSRLGIVDFNLPSNWWISQHQQSKFAVLVLGFEKLGLKLDNCGWTTRNAYCRIYIVYGRKWRRIRHWDAQIPLTLLFSEFASGGLVHRLKTPRITNH
jgi:hypothetical protein